MMPTWKAGISMDRVHTKSEDTTASPAMMQAGAFTFVEVLIALSVVAIALLALLKLHLVSLDIADRAQVMSQAVFLAEQKVAETLADGYPKPGTDSGTVQDSGVPLDWQVEVTDLRLPELRAASDKGLRKILVDVSWEQHLGRKHLQMTTYVARRDYVEK
jgi:type II secretion system protein I